MAILTSTGALAGVRARAPRRLVSVGGLLLGWLVLWVVLRGHDTLSLSPSALTPLHRWFNDLNDAIGRSRNSNPLFLYFFNEIRAALDTLVTFVQGLIAQPAYGRPIPVVGWLGVVALGGWAAAALGNIRVGLLAAAGLVFVGLQGLWRESMDTLALTVSAVLVALLIGIPLGVWVGLSPRATRSVTPVLDFMQTMPAFVYLAPMTLLFQIGPASATITTLIFAMPPTVRITGYGIRSVSSSVVEASESLGSTRLQALRSVMLPLAKRTIVLGINQTIMAAFAMVTVAALIDAPGLGKVIIKALTILDVGASFNAGLAIVVLAVVLDRVTTAASERVEVSRRRGRPSPARRPLVIGGLVIALVCVYLSRTYLWAAEFPSTIQLGGRSISVGVGSRIAQAADSTSAWVLDHFSGVTNGFRDLVTVRLLNPFQSLLTDSPWFVVVLVVVGLALVVGGRTAAITAAVCLALLIATGLWEDAMTTLASTLVATVLTMVLGIGFGVWMGRSMRADRLLRPLLDAGQTMPAFVYLVPFLALFAASRFTAIVAAIAYAAPVATKIVADGIRGVPTTSVEAAVAAGSNTWQVITKVQLPMARRALTLATNQGLIYVLSMVVVGGLVGAGALGYDVVAGFSQSNLFGKGLAAGLAIVLLGIMLDRITRAAADRAQTTAHL